MKNKFYCEKCKRQIEPFDDDTDGKPQMCEDCFKKMIDNADLESANLSLEMVTVSFTKEEIKLLHALWMSNKTDGIYDGERELYDSIDKKLSKQ